ncbi:YggS family pyridoxal phosphate-dependent enzyme [bacterium]|nr:YggS family pyridoxal phosphate-dependent enzyme [bacterium]
MDTTSWQGQIKANLDRVRENIAAAAAGREVALICVTKYAQDAWVEALLDAGAEQLAENLLPRGAERFARLFESGYRFTRHLIGAQQSKKLKLIPGQFDLFQAVDREKVATLLNEHLQAAGAELDVLLEINIAGEEQKHGFGADGAVETAARLAAECPALSIRGLMAVPPWPDAYADDAEFERETRTYFRQMRSLFDRMSADCPALTGLDTLSLGMSQDYVWAVEEGATMVRVGSALFAGI